MSVLSVHIIQMHCYWGEPERVPHKDGVREFCLSVYQSIRMFMNDNLQM